jgi:transposase
VRFVAPFPKHITKPIQYGPSVKSFAVYISQYQLILYARVQEVFKDQFDLKISQGSLCNFNREAYEKLEIFEADLIKKLRSEKVLNADETGIKINAQLARAHVLCTPKFTFI